MPTPVDIQNLPPDALLSGAEVAATFRLNAGTLRNLRTKGLAPRATKLGRAVRYRISDVRAWLEEQQEPTTL